VFVAREDAETKAKVWHIAYMLICLYAETKAKVRHIALVSHKIGMVWLQEQRMRGS
jgi:hypothetical protein